MRDFRNDALAFVAHFLDRALGDARQVADVPDEYSIAALIELIHLECQTLFSLGVSAQDYVFGMRFFSGDLVLPPLAMRFGGAGFSVDVWRRFHLDDDAFTARFERVTHGVFSF